MPTDALARLASTMKELDAFGFERAKSAQQELGDKVRRMFAQQGIASVAAPGFAAPTVVVSYTDDKDIQSGSKLARLGLQIAAGVPLQCDEPADFRTFRVGLFGIDKLRNVDRTVAHLETAFSQLTAEV